MKVLHILIKNEDKNSIIKIKEIPKKRKMLIFINPIGGKGKGKKVWDSVYLILGK
jgi:hypothetical protein